MPDHRRTTINRLYDGLTFVSRQSRDLGAQLHPDLPLVAYSLLSFIEAEPDARAADIAAAYGLDKSTVSRQITALETAGLLARTEERPGRRGHILQLTDAGALALNQAENSAQETLTAHLKDWPDEDIDTLASLLTRFTSRSDSTAISPD